mmetsp:Transcript_104467/g.248559  ORF Transcript_104467/g.248559 Transcript_104467/m.248559 type:complete len:212 (-) Transcript_104467:307-942(-)
MELKCSEGLWQGDPLHRNAVGLPGPRKGIRGHLLRLQQVHGKVLGRRGVENCEGALPEGDLWKPVLADVAALVRLLEAHHLGVLLGVGPHGAQPLHGQGGVRHVTSAHEAQGVNLEGEQVRLKPVEAKSLHPVAVMKVHPRGVRPVSLHHRPPGQVGGLDEILHPELPGTLPVRGFQEVQRFDSLEPALRSSVHQDSCTLGALAPTHSFST